MRGGSQACWKRSPPSFPWSLACTGAVPIPLTSSPSSTSPRSRSHLAPPHFQPPVVGLHLASVPGEVAFTPGGGVLPRRRDREEEPDRWCCLHHLAHRHASTTSHAGEGSGPRAPQVGSGASSRVGHGEEVAAVMADGSGDEG
ncbi:unnamed protein product [Miscanthus lutarioriparius]|uniref:Uncharacterized protein n=1 Tax=Miscanthus lutarioriparius TaxID=422564 RepID=A0A811PT71_9POAL|nr:unnamed protein product [Miscanthus lutarioriparius]